MGGSERGPERLNPGEYAVMSRVEDAHWWYRGLRDALVQTMRSRGPGLPERPRILDAGCGTGRNLVCLRDEFNPSYLGGFDASFEALEFARKKVPEARLFAADICDPTLPEGDLDLVTSLDVIYIPGADRAQPGLRTLVDSLRSGGRFVLNLPAYNWLYSEHDAAIHTSERFTATGVRRLLEEIGLEVDCLTYRICFLFPVVAAARLPSLLRGRMQPGAARSDLHSVPGSSLNRILYGVLQLENGLIKNGMRLPFGSSVFAIGRKP